MCWVVRVFCFGRKLRLTVKTSSEIITVRHLTWFKRGCLRKGVLKKWGFCFDCLCTLYELMSWTYKCIEVRPCFSHKLLTTEKFPNLLFHRWDKTQEDLRALASQFHIQYSKFIHVHLRNVNRVLKRKLQDAKENKTQILCILLLTSG